MSLLLLALGAFNRRAKVLTMNVRVRGQPAALTLIPDAQFGRDETGKTILNSIYKP